MGNGPLTDYGRALGATTIAARSFWPAKKSEDEIAQKSGFLYSTPKNTWLRPTLNARGLYLRRKLDTPREASESIPMQADANLVLKSGATDNLILVATMGHAATPVTSKKDGEDSSWRSREHYLAYRSDHWGLYMGMMDKAYGIRTEDHTAYARSITALAQNDQTHGVMWHYHYPSFDFALQGFAGNLGQQADIRQQGISSYFEYSLTPYWRFGGSVLSSSSDFLKMQSTSVHGRWGFGKGSALLTELGQSNKSGVKNSKEITSNFFLLQGHMRVQRGLHLIYALEWLQADSDKQSKILRLGPALQYFPHTGVEWRLDLFNSRSMSETSVREDTWDAALQLHLWL